MNGDKIQELRVKSGYTIDQFAEIMDEDVGTIQSWEQGWHLHPLSEGDIEIMAEIFHMTEDELRECIEHDKEDDWDSENDSIRFVDYVDAAVRASKYVGKTYRNINEEK